LENWQRKWETTNKGGITTEYFPEVRERLHTKINLTQNFTTMVMGRGNIKSYLHRFKIIDTSNCPCGNGHQTMEHILLECATLQEDRERLIAEVAKTGDWPISKDMLIKKHYKAFAKFTKKLMKLRKLIHKKNISGRATREETSERAFFSYMKRRNNHCKYQL